jgi:hypothetical protein
MNQLSLVILLKTSYFETVSSYFNYMKKSCDCTSDKENAS